MEVAEEANLVKNFVNQQIHKISETRNESSSKALLANLRRGIGTVPGSMPVLWGVTFGDLPEELKGSDEHITNAEWSIHTVLTLYAHHQQGKDIKSDSMSKQGYSLGIALRKLISDDDDEKRIKRRFDAAATSDSLEEFAQHLRGLIQLLRSKSIPLDYPQVAQDLYWFQNPDFRDSVRLRWGRDFYSYERRLENIQG